MKRRGVVLAHTERIWILRAIVLAAVLFLLTCVGTISRPTTVKAAQEANCPTTCPPRVNGGWIVFPAEGGRIEGIKGYVYSACPNNGACGPICGPPPLTFETTCIDTSQQILVGGQLVYPQIIFVSATFELGPLNPNLLAGGIVQLSRAYVGNTDYDIEQLPCSAFQAQQLQPLSCSASTPTADVNQTIDFTVSGGTINCSPSTYGWSAPGGNPSSGSESSFSTSFSSAGEKTVTVTSNGQTSSSTVTVNSSACPIDPLAAPVGRAIAFESTAPKAPIDSLFPPDVDPNLSQAITSLEFEVNSNLWLFGSGFSGISRSSGYRPPDYQLHLRQIRDKRQEIAEAHLTAEQTAACKTDVIDKVTKEITKTHGLTCNGGGECGPNDIPTVSTAGKHTRVPAQAMDMSGMKGLSTFRQLLIDSMAKRFNLWRPHRLKDPVHFELINPYQSSPQHLRVMVQSPLDALVTDPEGKRIGYNSANNSVVNEIGALASYTGRGTEPQIIEIDGATFGNYLVTGIGTGTGPYTLTIERYSEDSDLLDSKVITGTISPGETIAVNFVVPEIVLVDIKPGDFDNIVPLQSQGVLPLAILSTQGFDATTLVDQSSLTFGHTGDEQSLAFPPSVQDVDGDGLPDLICHFRISRTALVTTAVLGVLKGRLINGTPFRGEDWVQVR